MAVETGDTDTCRHCKEKVVWDYTPDQKEIIESRPWATRYKMVWHHVGTGIVKCGDPENREDDRRAAPVHWCTARLSGDRYGETCNRPVKEYGACGTHREDAKRHWENEQRIDELMQQDKYVEEELGSVVEMWNTLYDLDAKLDVTPYYRRNSDANYRSGQAKYTGYVLVNPARLADLMSKIEEEL